jgi:hypothetical protein
MILGHYEAHAWIDSRDERLFDPPFFAGTRWAPPGSPQLLFSSAATPARR